MNTKTGQKRQGLVTAVAATAALAGALIALPALADHDDRSHSRTRTGYSTYDYAQVIDVDPIVRQVRVETPVRECWEETRYRRYDDGPRRGSSKAGATIAGGIIGGVIGHQFGSGSGNDAATILGSLIGAAIGNDGGSRADRRRGYESQGYSTESYPVERCDVRYEATTEERIEGYNVTYVYNGQRLTTQTDYDPGERIRVKVSVLPAR